MRWCFLAQGEDHGRMHSRVIQIMDHLLIPVSCFSLAKLEDRLFFSFAVEADEKQALRIESLLRKIYGMLSVDASLETATMQRMIALFRVRCDIFERDELLHFIGAIPNSTGVRHTAEGQLLSAFTISLTSLLYASIGIEVVGIRQELLTVTNLSALMDC